MGLFSNLFGRGSSDAKLQDQIFNLKFTAKSLARAAKKCESEEKANKSKVRDDYGDARASRESIASRVETRMRFWLMVPGGEIVRNDATTDGGPFSTQVKRAIERGNIDGAKIHAQDAIRKKNEGLNMLRLASRLDGVVARLETQAKMNAVNADMSGIVKSLEKSLNANNLEQVSETMDTFERQFENLDVQTEFVEQAMGNTSALSTPPEDVATLMQQIADEHGLEFAADLPSAGTTVPGEKQAEKDLSMRLEELKGGA
jgi:charged multivesicular body protein 1